MHAESAWTVRAVPHIWLETIEGECNGLHRTLLACGQTTEMAGLASDSNWQTLSDASINAPISGAE
jgi:hypothetical protein